MRKWVVGGRRKSEPRPLGREYPVLRYARFAFSAVLLVAFLFVTSLWVRSYRTKDVLWVHLGADDFLRMSSQSGRLIISVKQLTNMSAPWMLRHTRPGRLDYEDDLGKKPGGWWVKTLKWKSGLTEYHMHLCVPAATFLLLVTLVSPQRRFSLRTLLLAATLLALLLGIAASWHPEITKIQLRASASLPRNTLHASVVPRYTPWQNPIPTAESPLTPTMIRRVHFLQSRVESQTPMTKSLA